MPPTKPSLGSLHPNTKPSVVRAVVERILQRRLDASTHPPAEQAAETRRALEDLTSRANDVVDTAGLAAYLRDGRDGQLRGLVTWASDAAMTRSQYFLPRVVERVMTEGDLLMLGDVGAPSALDHPDRLRDNTHGIVAAPVKQGPDVVGAICAFDDTPVRLSESALTAFEQLGASGLERAAPPQQVDRRATADASTMAPPSVERRIDTVLENLDKEAPIAVPAAAPITDDPEWEPTLMKIAVNLRWPASWPAHAANSVN